ncbi:MAG: hypothetical protein ACUVQ1_00420 [Candidatus Kapaibacteriales bacterium]
MKRNLSIAFGTDRTYVALIEKKPEGLLLKFVGITSQAVDLENFDTKINMVALNELFQLIKKINITFDFVNISIPVETTFVSKFQGRSNISIKEALTIVNLEIRQLYPQYNTNDFPTYLLQLSPIKNNPYYLAIIIPKKIYQNIKKITSAFNRLAEKIEISQLNAHSAVLYNYPELAEKKLAIFNIQENFIDFSSISGKDLLSYDLLQFTEKKEIPMIIKNAIISKRSEIGINFDSVFLFGEGLERNSFDNISNVVSSEVTQVKRLNAFRLFRSEVDTVTKDFCASTAHLFPPCVGASIPSYHQKIKII